MGKIALISFLLLIVGYGGYDLGKRQHPETTGVTVDVTVGQPVMGTLAVCHGSMAKIETGPNQHVFVCTMGVNTGCPDPMKIGGMLVCLSDQDALYGAVDLTKLGLDR